MITVSLRLPDELLDEVDRYASDMHLRRTAYIRLALEIMNEQAKKKARREKLMAASRLVRSESMKVNKEFSEFEDDAID